MYSVTPPIEVENWKKSKRQKNNLAIFARNESISKWLVFVLWSCQRVLEFNLLRWIKRSNTEFWQVQDFIFSKIRSNLIIFKHSSAQWTSSVRGRFIASFRSLINKTEFHFRWLNIKEFNAALPFMIMLFQPSKLKLI